MIQPKQPEMMQRVRRLLPDLIKKLRREPPEDPYAYVGAPKKPKPPTHRAGAKADPYA